VGECSGMSPAVGLALFVKARARAASARRSQARGGGSKSATLYWGSSGAKTLAITVRANRA